MAQDPGAAWILLLDVALVGLFTAISPDNVFWSSSQRAVLIDRACRRAFSLPLGFLSCSAPPALFDLSIGGSYFFPSVVGAMVLAISNPSHGDPRLTPTPARNSAALLACIVTGALFGLVNGLIVAIST